MRLHNGLISALFWITYGVEILSQMNRLAAPALGESFAVEIRASAASRALAVFSVADDPDRRAAPLGTLEFKTGSMQASSRMK